VAIRSGPLPFRFPLGLRRFHPDWRGTCWIVNGNGGLEKQGSFPF
jgi:hypothetical protein